MRLSFFEMLKWRTSGTLMADAGRDPGTLRSAYRVTAECRRSATKGDKKTGVVTKGDKKTGVV